MNTNEMDIWDCAEECAFDDFVKKYDKKYLNKQNDYGYTLLHEALSGRHVETVMFLIKEGADVNIQDNWGNTVLYYLAKETMCPPVLMMLTAFLESGADVNIQNNEGTTPLLAASIKATDEEEMRKFELLLNRNGNIDMENQFGLSVRKVAEIHKTKYKNGRLLDFLSKKKCNMENV